MLQLNHPRAFYSVIEAALAINRRQAGIWNSEPGRQGTVPLPLAFLIFSGLEQK